MTSSRYNHSKMMQVKQLRDLSSRLVTAS